MTTSVKPNSTPASLLFQELPFLFDDFFTKELSGKSLLSRGFSPAVNIKENESGYTISVAAPGFDKSDFRIELKENNLTVSAKKEFKTDSAAQEKFIRREFEFQSFSRSFSLPDNAVNNENISAGYENGILNIQIPKKDKVSLVKEITIS